MNRISKYAGPGLMAATSAALLFGTIGQEANVSAEFAVHTEAPTKEDEVSSGVQDDWEDTTFAENDLPQSDWKLVSIEGVGESDLNDRDYWEAAIYRFNFDLGGTAVSCMVAVDAAHDFPGTGYLDPSACFIDGDVSRPLVAQRDR